MDFDSILADSFDQRVNPRAIDNYFDAIGSICGSKPIFPFADADM